VTLGDEFGGLLEEERHEAHGSAHHAEEEPLGEVLAYVPPLGLLLQVLFVDLRVRHVVVQALVLVHPLLLGEGEMVGRMARPQIAIALLRWTRKESPAQASLHGREDTAPS
jgi:hypothetical protein